VRFLEKELRLKRARALPSRIECGYLRSAIRSCFDHLDDLQELSVKTTQKLEKSYCPFCDSTKGPKRVEKWKKERFDAIEVDNDHLALFVSQLGRNVDVGWNRGKYPYIPNGHACLGVTRREGGTWIPGEFSAACDVTSVVSAGKPRIVTLFSERNNAILTPLHHSLYDSLRRKGWLLVGDPTDDVISSLNGCEYISVDYRQATDNIKVAYTRAAIEVLIDKGVELNDDEVRALRVVGSLEIDGSLATRGQPMGSLMSFPLLCLVNKTVVDLAHNDLLIEGRISFKEWTSHRCLINGDDLLLRDLQPPGELLPRIVAHGERVGLSVNTEKTMVDAEKGEINSTLFENGIKRKKLNCSALFMGQDENDVIGFSDRSTLTTEGFLFCVRRARDRLARQEVKLCGPLPCDRFNALVRDPQLRQSLTTQFSRGTKATNVFPVVTKPVGYDLSRQEEIVLIKERVDWLRSISYVPPLRTRDGQSEVGRTSLRIALKRKKPADEDTCLSVLAIGWEKKQKELAVAKDTLSERVPYEHVCDFCSGSSRIEQMVCEIRDLKRATWLPARECQVPGTDPSGWAL